MRAEVAVIGAGPAGSSAAAVLAREGFKVILLEEHDRPGEPQHCAGMLTKEACRRLKIEVPREAVQSEPSHVAIYYGPTSFRARMGIYVLDRTSFDQRMAESAVDAGAELLTGHKVIGMRRSGRGWLLSIRGGLNLEAELVIGADGYKALSPRWAGLEGPSEAASCLQYKLELDGEVDQDVVSCYFGSSVAPGGYAWVVPIGDRAVRVGLGVRKAPKPARYYLDALMRKLFPGSRVVKRMAGLVSTSGPVVPSCTDAYLAIGEAAGHVNPLTGAGIASSIASGRIAGLIASRALEEGDLSAQMLSAHYRAWRSAVGRYHELAFEARRALESMTGKEIAILAKGLSSRGRKNRFLTALGLLARKPGLVRFLFKTRELKLALCL